MKSAAYYEGQEAFETGSARIDNPYPPFDPSHRGWNLGWQAAKAAQDEEELVEEWADVDEVESMDHLREPSEDEDHG